MTRIVFLERLPEGFRYCPNERLNAQGIGIWNLRRHDKTYDEIGEVYGVSGARVCQVIHRVKAKLDSDKRLQENARTFKQGIMVRR